MRITEPKYLLYWHKSEACPPILVILCNCSGFSYELKTNKQKKPVCLSLQDSEEFTWWANNYMTHKTETYFYVPFSVIQCGDLNHLLSSQSPFSILPDGVALFITFVALSFP